MTQPIDEDDLDWGFDPDKPIRVRKFLPARGEEEYHDFATSFEVAELMHLDQTEVEWAIEEFGRCDNDTYVAWQPTDRNGRDWPNFDAPEED